MIIWGKFGVTMSDDGGKKWSTTSLRSVNACLQNINNAVNNRLKSLIGGVSFWLQEEFITGSVYHGKTHPDGSGVDFFTTGDVALRQINVYHEVGHLLDNVPGMKDVFMNAVSNEDNPSWVDDDQQINPDALKGKRIYNDPNYPSVQARQTYSFFGSAEQWADAFGNYVAGNINRGNTTGIDMANFVSNALAPYIGVP
jgi:hypothetical protein